MGKTRTASGMVSSTPTEVFTLLTDIDRLPEWNRIIVSVAERPDAMTPGAQWVVRLKAMGSSWPSRSTLEEFDPDRHVLAYRSCTDDGNPSYARWRWTVEPDGDAGSVVTVNWDLHPQTFWRRVLLARMRDRQLRSEVPASIESLARTLRTPSV